MPNFCTHTKRLISHRNRATLLDMQLNNISNPTPYPFMTTVTGTVKNGSYIKAPNVCQNHLCWCKQPWPTKGTKQQTKKWLALHNMGWGEKICVSNQQQPNVLSINVVIHQIHDTNTFEQTTSSFQCFKN